MTVFNRLIAAAGLALAMVAAVPAASIAPDKPASCRLRVCEPLVCLDSATCPSPRPPQV